MKSRFLALAILCASFLSTQARAACWYSEDGEKFQKSSASSLGECKDRSKQHNRDVWIYISRIDVEGVRIVKVLFLKDGEIADVVSKFE